jgi:hypothetical protein
MRRQRIVSASLLLGLAACGETVATSGSGGSGAVTTSGTTASSSSSGATGGASVTLTLDSFTVPPGGEVYYCQNFANPFGGVDAEVSEFESHMALGSHHMLLFYKEGASNDPLEPCSGLEFAATPYSTQLPNDSLSFPPGVAALVPGADGFRIQSHYLNVTSTTITASVKVTLHLAAPGTVQQQAGVLFVVDSDINVPPGPAATATVSDDCTIPLKVGSHMHQHGTDFVATAAGAPLFQTSNWSDPSPAEFSPPKVLQAGAPLHFACSYLNNSDQPLTFGESALTDEMCILVASFYPTPTGQATIVANNCTTSQSP